jgi:hypothetical protein
VREITHAPYGKRAKTAGGSQITGLCNAGEEREVDSRWAMM